MSYHDSIRRLVREAGIAVHEIYWMAGVSTESIPDGLREIIEENDAESVGDLFGVEVVGYVHPEEFSAEDFLGAVHQLGAKLDGFLARVSIPVRYYGPEGDYVTSRDAGYVQDFYAATPEELTGLIAAAVDAFASLDKETGDQVRQGTPLFTECGCDECCSCGDEDEESSVH